jgi:hypothetical protein
MTEEAVPTDVLADDQHRVTDVPGLSRIIADRHAFIAAPHDWVDLKELTFLGFTRAEWIRAGAPTHYPGTNYRCLHADLLILCGMLEAVERWRREAASQCDGESGPFQPL